MTTPPILALESITKHYGSQTILFDIDFQVTEAQIIALVAPNGTGKTTLLNVIANIEKADEGFVTVLGKDNSDHRIFHEMSYLQDNTVLYSHLTGYDHLVFVANEHRLSKEKLNALIDKIGIRHYLKKRINQYSLGMKQHLLLAIALVNQPKLLLLDEPLNGLDPDSVILVRQILTELKEAGTTIILSSHNLVEIERLADTIYFLVEEGLLNSQDVLVEASTYLLVLEKTEFLEHYATSHSMPCKRISEYKLSIRLTQAELASLKETCLQANVKLLDVSLAEGVLQNAYFELFHKGGAHVPL